MKFKIENFIGYNKLKNKKFGYYKDHIYNVNELINEVVEIN